MGRGRPGRPGGRIERGPRPRRGHGAGKEGPGQAAAAAGTARLPRPEQLQGQEARASKNDCAGQGDCATAKAHVCKAHNDCAGLGGCGENPGENKCKGMGGCEVPLKDEAWAKARKNFEAAMKKAGKKFGDAPKP